MPHWDKATQVVKRRYDRIAPLYDIIEGVPELYFRKWRRLLWSKIEGDRILEIGVGTGKNLPYYPSEAHVVAIDFSPKMLARARGKAEKLGTKVSFYQMDVQCLEFQEASFDTVLASFVFCSVPDPCQGLKEVKRVCKPGGKVLLLEHSLSTNPLVARWMELINPLVRLTIGDNINRRTEANVTQSGLVIEQVIDLAIGVFKLIEARKA